MAFNPPISDQKGPDPKRDNGGLKTLVQAEKLVQIALVLPCAVFIGWAGGAALDRWLHQEWIVVVGLVLGAAGGLSAAVRMALQSGEGKKP